MNKYEKAAHAAANEQIVPASVFRQNHAPVANLPETGFVKLWQIIGDVRRGIPAVFPISRSGWYQGIKEGRFPAPVKLGPRSSAWRVSDIQALLESVTAQGGGYV